MRIPFDIKFRPQIESGEYKVVTGDDRPVRIISWDKKVYGGRYEIVALVPTSQGDTESVQLYCHDGTFIASTWNEKFKLFIVTPEPELTEFEKELESFYNHHLQVCTYDNQGTVEDSLHDWASKLLAIARKELYTTIKRELEENPNGWVQRVEDAYNSGLKTGYKNGRAEALRDLPRWKKCGKDTLRTYGEEHFEYRGGVCYLVMKGREIILSDLAKLPKED